MHTYGYRGFESLPLRQEAGVIQWQNRSFPCFLRGFDSPRPLHFLCEPPTLEVKRAVALGGGLGGMRHHHERKRLAAETEQ